MLIHKFSQLFKLGLPCLNKILRSDTNLLEIWSSNPKKSLIRNYNMWLFRFNSPRGDFSKLLKSVIISIIIT
jgi:hypothetical protein